MKATMEKLSDEKFEVMLDKMITNGWLVEHADGTFELTNKGFEAAQMYEELLKMNEAKQ